MTVCTCFLLSLFSPELELLIIGTSIFCQPYVGLNKDFKSMLSEHAEFKALTLKDSIKASDGTRKVDISFLVVIIPLVSSWKCCLLGLNHFQFEVTWIS